jgi:hypothetical protein
MLKQDEFFYLQSAKNNHKARKDLQAVAENGFG